MPSARASLSVHGVEAQTPATTPLASQPRIVSYVAPLEAGGEFPPLPLKKVLEDSAHHELHGGVSVQEGFPLRSRQPCELQGEAPALVVTAN